MASRRVNKTAAEPPMGLDDATPARSPRQARERAPPLIGQLPTRAAPNVGADHSGAHAVPPAAGVERVLLLAIVSSSAVSGSLAAAAHVLPTSAWQRIGAALPDALLPPSIIAWFRAFVAVSMFAAAWVATSRPSGARLATLACLAWQVGAALDLFDGPLARQTATTSAFGAWLDADVLDPLGSWTVLAAAHASLPEYRAVWALILLRSIPPFGTELKLGEDGETALSAVVPYIPTTHVVWAVACAGTVLRWARVRRAVGERAARIAARIAVAAAALAAAAHPL